MQPSKCFKLNIFLIFYLFFVWVIYVFIFTLLFYFMGNSNKIMSMASVSSYILTLVPTITSQRKHNILTKNFNSRSVTRLAPPCGMGASLWAMGGTQTRRQCFEPHISCTSSDMPSPPHPFADAGGLIFCPRDDPCVHRRFAIRAKNKKQLW